MLMLIITNTTRFDSKTTELQYTTNAKWKVFSRVLDNVRISNRLGRNTNTEKSAKVHTLARVDAC